MQSKGDLIDYVNIACLLVVNCLVLNDIQSVMPHSEDCIMQDISDEADSSTVQHGHSKADI